MSTLKANTLSNVAGTKSVPTETVVDGSAKAWVNFNGAGTVATRDSFNVSSLIDNGTGDYTVVEAVSLSATVSVSVASNEDATAPTGHNTALPNVTGNAIAVGSVRVVCRSNTAVIDRGIVTVSCLGGYA